MTKKILSRIFLVFVVVVLNAYLFSIPPQSPPYVSRTEWKKFQLDFFAAYAPINPVDLNLLVDYDEGRLKYAYEDQYRFFDSLYGANYSYSHSREGVFNRIKQAFPLGIRLRYNIRPNLALSLGLQYFSREASSHIADRHEVEGVAPDELVFHKSFTRILESSPYLISMNGYAVQGGVHWKIPLKGIIDLETFITAGRWYGQLRYLNQYSNEFSTSWGYWSQRINRTEYLGDGNGLILEAGGRLNIDLGSWIGLFFETGYCYQRANNFIGSEERELWYSDSDAEETYEHLGEWPGLWVVQDFISQGIWGEVRGKQPLLISSERRTDEMEDFRLDLSGIRIRFGFSLRF
jgi:hypothetical protein